MVLLQKPLDRAEALAAALTRAGYTCTVAGRRVHVQAPAFTLAHVRLDERGFTCVFDANALFAQPRGACVAWGIWTQALRTATALHFPTLAHLPLPAAELEPLPAPAPVDLSECLYSHWIGPSVPERCRHACDETREGRFAVFALYDAPAWSSMSSDDLGWDGPSIGWHAWAEPVAVELGAAKGWAGIAGLEIGAYHEHRRPVEQVLLAAAEKPPAPAGLEALDLRGLEPNLAAKLVTALVSAARARADGRGAIVLCNQHTSYLIARTVDLDCLPLQNDAQQSFALD